MDLAAFHARPQVSDDLRHKILQLKGDLHCKGILLTCFGNMTSKAIGQSYRSHGLFCGCNVHAPLNDHNIALAMENIPAWLEDPTRVTHVSISQLDRHTCRGLRGRFLRWFEKTHKKKAHIQPGEFIAAMLLLGYSANWGLPNKGLHPKFTHKIQVGGCPTPPPTPAHA